MTPLVAASEGWVPLVLSPLVLLAWIGLVVLLFRSRTLLRRVRHRLRWWRQVVSSRLTRKEQLREAARLADEMGVGDPPAVPPPTEHPLWPALWMVEVYLPTHAEALADAIRKLGWDQEGALGRSDALAWLREARARGRLSYTSPGAFRSPRPIPPGMISWAPQIDIPETFDYLNTRFIQLGPGVTVLVAAFTLAEDERSCLERALREPASARAEATSWTGHSVYPASVVRLERLGAERERIRSAASRWIARNIPGSFSERAKELPSWDLITTEVEPPTATNLPNDDWRQALGLGFGADLYSVDPPSEDLILATPGFREQSNPRPSFCGRRQTLIDAVVGADKTFSGVLHRINEQVFPILAMWGVLDAVQEYDAALAGPRDQRLTTKENYRATRRHLEHIRDGVLPAASDLGTLESLAEFLEQPESLHWFEFRVANPTLLGDESGVTLVSSLRGRLSERTHSARQRAKEVSEAMRAYGEILVASSNLRLQRRIYVLTAVLIVLTLVGIWIARQHDETQATPKSPVSRVGR
jgi:hypothetical protein